MPPNLTMRRRDFITIMSLGAAAPPLAVRAEWPNSAPLIGVLLAIRADDALSKWFMTAFGKTVREHGSALGQNIKIEYRFGSGDTDLAQTFARELIGMRPAVIVAMSNTSMPHCTVRLRRFQLFSLMLVTLWEWDT